MENIFQQATRKNVLFASSRGVLTVQQLWVLPLTSKTNAPNLDDVAKGINAELKSAAEESFVATSTNPRKGELELQLDVVKAIIAYRLEESEKRRDAAARAEKRAFLVDLLDKKRADALGELSVEEIEKQIAALG